MDGVRTSLAGDFENKIAAQIGFGGWSWAKPMGLVRMEHVQGGAVCVRVDGDGSDAEFAAGTDDAQGNFTTVGDEQLA